MKKFISVSPFQKPDKLGKGIYVPANSDVLGYDKAVSFPVIPIINGYADEGEKISVITVVSEYPNAKANYITLKNDLNTLAIEKKLDISYTEISVPYNNDLKVQLGVFTQLINCISDNDKLYCDITFGSKVMNQIFTMSMHYGYRARSGVMIGCTAYGEYDHNTDDLKIYDITSLSYLDEIVRTMADKGIGDPTNAIKMMMDWEDEADG